MGLYVPHPRPPMPEEYLERQRHKERMNETKELAKEILVSVVSNMKEIAPVMADLLPEFAIDTAFKFMDQFEKKVEDVEDGQKKG